MGPGARQAGVTRARVVPPCLEETTALPRSVLWGAGASLWRAPRGVLL